jgi:glutamate--cysteine ligase
VALAQAGLRARARAGAGRADEAGYLDVLVESLEAKAVQADRLLALYHGAWGGRLSQIYETVSY